MKKIYRLGSWSTGIKETAGGHQSYRDNKLRSRANIRASIELGGRGKQRGGLVRDDFSFSADKTWLQGEGERPFFSCWRKRDTIVVHH